MNNISIQGWLLHFRRPVEGTAKPVYYALALVSIVLTADLLYQLERRGAALAQVAVTPLSWWRFRRLAGRTTAMFCPAGSCAGAGWVPHLRFAPGLAWLRVSAACFAWVAVLGLYISPMRIAS